MGSSNGGVPPGFRFHPTDEELLHYYLTKKVSFQKFDTEVIREVDLNKMEPWELQERCRIGSSPQNEWYFFSHKDRKYPTGSRTNRATNAGFWKATGRDKCIRNSYKKIGMRKTLVFYRGRAPHGQKTDWIMHEYRLEDGDDPQGNPTEDGWVVCRVFKKKNLFKVSNTINGELNKAELALHYPPHIPTPTHQYSLFHPQTLLPTHKSMTAYEYAPPPPVGLPSESSHPIMIKQLMSSNPRDCDSGSESVRYQCETGLEGQDSSSKGVRFEDSNNNGTNATSVHPINQLSLRGEMDFWGYGK
ncbi:hypothetical protein GOBAR_DD19390 [Gossypium barbadense]|nr:hypothetical protein GOBAR_DD19390 [Gossypium barbadense]